VVVNKINRMGEYLWGEEGITFRRHSKRDEKGKNSAKGKNLKKDNVGTETFQIPSLLTGHIDIVQVRNGQIHLLDYKPKAKKEKPIEQLTWYALDLSRLTGLRLYEFKCAWFDETDYFEFYPLHVVKKIMSKKKRNVHYRSGIKTEIPQDDIIKIIRRHSYR